tara:strand:+ start:564 stop:689 length:126 start_codon:yes stop_codon:yes gene_type:complete
MLKITIGFILGVIVMFIAIGIVLIVKDEKRILKLKQKAKER